MGWATPKRDALGVNRRVVVAAIRRLYPDKLPVVAFFLDPRYDFASFFRRENCYSYLPKEYETRRDLVRFIDSDQIRDGALDDADLLVMPPSEAFPVDCFDAAAAFVRDGGTLVLTGSNPLSYDARLDPETNRYRLDKNISPHWSENLKTLRISWFAWWTRKDVPEKCEAVVADETASFVPTRGENPFAGFQTSLPACRFYDAAALRNGDEMIPLIEGRDGDFRAATACIYDFHSDYKGAVVVSGLFDSDGTYSNNVASLADQAVFLPQAILAAFNAGVERFFWYEFQSAEFDDKDPEAHFGLVRRKLEPKPAYFAYQALTKARPVGSTEDRLEATDDAAVFSWRRPDGKKGWAIQTFLSTRKKTPTFKGEISEAFDYLGQTVAAPENDAPLESAPGILYLVGPETLALS